MGPGQLSPGCGKEPCFMEAGGRELIPCFHELLYFLVLKTQPSHPARLTHCGCFGALLSSWGGCLGHPQAFWRTAWQPLQIPLLLPGSWAQPWNKPRAGLQLPAGPTDCRPTDRCPTCSSPAAPAVLPGAPQKQGSALPTPPCADQAPSQGRGPQVLGEPIHPSETSLRWPL